MSIASLGCVEKFLHQTIFRYTYIRFIEPVFRIQSYVTGTSTHTHTQWYCLADNPYPESYPSYTSRTRLHRIEPCYEIGIAYGCTARMASHIQIHIHHIQWIEVRTSLSQRKNSFVSRTIVPRVWQSISRCIYININAIMLDNIVPK